MKVLRPFGHHHHPQDPVKIITDLSGAGFSCRTAQYTPIFGQVISVPGRDLCARQRSSQPAQLAAGRCWLLVELGRATRRNGEGIAKRRRGYSLSNSWFSWVYRGKF